MCSTQGGAELRRIIKATAMSMVCSCGASERQHARGIVLSQVVESLTHVPAGKRNPASAAYHATICCTVLLQVPGLEQL